MSRMLTQKSGGKDRGRQVLILSLSRVHSSVSDVPNVRGVTRGKSTTVAHRDSGVMPRGTMERHQPKSKEYKYKESVCVCKTKTFSHVVRELPSIAHNKIENAVTT